MNVGLDPLWNLLQNALKPDEDGERAQTNGTGANGSDIRFKSDIQDITNALDKVKQLQGKTFVYNGCAGRQMGMIAQEVKPIVPEVVMVDEDGYHLMCYDRLVALLIESVKELSNEVEMLKNKL